MINPIGSFVVWRELYTKPIWLNSTPEQKTILMTILAMANFSARSWEFDGKTFDVEKGQFVTSLQSIVDNSGKGITIQNVRSALKRFEKLGFLTNESTKTGRLVTIANWELYQSEKIKQQRTQQRGNKEVTKSQQRGNKEVTSRDISNKVNKDKESNIINSQSEIDIAEIRKLYPGNAKNKKDSERMLHKLIKQYGKEQLIRCTERYTKYVESERINGFKDLKFKNERTFWNGGYVDYLDENYVEQTVKADGDVVRHWDYGRSFKNGEC